MLLTIKMNLKWSIIVLSVPLFINAQIISGIDTLKFDCNTRNQPGINFSTGTLSYNPPNYFYYTSYPCSLSTNGMDCFVDISIPNCECPPGSSFYIVSPKLFYKSKMDFNSLNLKDSLAINDTGLFNKIDTARNQSNCWLPSILFSYVTNSINLHDSTILIKTSFNKYVLVQINPIATEKYLYCTDFGNWFFYLHGIILNWYLQNNGSLDFSEVKQTSIYSREKNQNQKLLSHKIMLEKYHVGMGKDVLRCNGSIFYSLKGERLVGINLKNINTLIIYK